MQRGRSGAGLCCAAAVALLLALAPPALAGGDWGSKADFTHLNVSWKDDAGNAAFYEVFKLPVRVQSAATPDGRQCMVGQPDGSPNTVECPVPHVTSGQVTITTTQAMACSASIGNEVSEDSSTYKPQESITSRNSCGGGGGGGGSGVNPCDCSKVTAFLNHFGVLGAHQNRIQFVVHAELTCTPGTGTGCRGELGVRAPRRAKFVSPGKGKRLDLSCEGDCDRATELHRTLQFKVRHAIKANRTVRIRTSLICLSPAGVPRPGKVVTMAVRFGEHGSVDYEKSDLNGDGKPDKGQLR